MMMAKRGHGRIHLSLARGANSRYPTLLLLAISLRPLSLPQPSPADMVIRLGIYIHSLIRVGILPPRIRINTSFPP
jgi:hypothetical protein